MGERKDRSSQLAEKFGCIGCWCFGNGYYAINEAEDNPIDFLTEEKEYAEYCFTKCVYTHQCWEAFLEENNCSQTDEEIIERASFKHFISGLTSKPINNH
ncbi:MAG: hypothetical protein HZA77_10325 [Candidatus Schekmanbacteria bacterium]|nr:hypothetical protein [Candidatus Schekmanbacteria bacterium]